MDIVVQMIALNAEIVRGAIENAVELDKHFEGSTG